MRYAEQEICLLKRRIFYINLVNSTLCGVEVSALTRFFSLKGTPLSRMRFTTTQKNVLIFERDLPDYLLNLVIFHQLKLLSLDKDH